MFFEFALSLKCQDGFKSGLEELRNISLLKEFYCFIVAEQRTRLIFLFSRSSLQSGLYRFVSFCFVSFRIVGIGNHRNAVSAMQSDLIWDEMLHEREGLPPFPNLSHRINIFGFHSFQFAVISFLLLAMIIRIQWTIQEFVLLIKEEKQAQWQDSWRRRDMTRERTNLFNHLIGMIGEEITIWNIDLTND